MPDQKEFITHFEVSNFKKFDHLVVEDIGQFNLITGDNNVGKTCLLEAFTIDKNIDYTISYFNNNIQQRKLANIVEILNVNILDYKSIFENNVVGINIKLNLPKVAKILANIKYQNSETLEIEIINCIEKIRETDVEEKIKFIDKYNLFGYKEINENSNNWILYKVNSNYTFFLDLTSEIYNSFLHKHNSHPILFLGDSIERYVIINYDKIFGSFSKIKRILELINILFDNLNILDIRMSKASGDLVSDWDNNEYGKLFVASKDRDFHNIREYGEGFVRILNILFLILSGSKKIMIDEIDTGIHHSKMKEVWLKVLSLCRDEKIQLFATTHSRECIEAYAQALKELNMEEKGRLITLKEKDGIIFANTKNHEVFNYGLENGYNGLG